jgi:Zn-dependent protease/predicted transcriptional regulator
LQLGSALGIPIRLHTTFLLLLVWFGYHSTRSGNRLVWSLAYLGLVFLCVVLHELGHAAMARRFGVRTREIVLYPVGGIARLEAMPAGRAELFIALAGPAVNVAVAGVLVLVARISGGSLLWDGRLTSAGDLLPGLFVLNLILFFFNLLPAFPMDGGRVLRAGLALLTNQERATRIATRVGQGVAVLFAIAAILPPLNPLLLLIALFVFVGASQEAGFYRQRTSMLGAAARRVMNSRFESLLPGDSLEHAARRLLGTHQDAFPVVDAAGRAVGLLPRPVLLQGLAEGGTGAHVADVMLRDFPVVGADENVERVVVLLRAQPDCPLTVVERGKPAGMITLADLAGFVRSVQAGQSR